jgi:hypothetical protein
VRAHLRCNVSNVPRWSRGRGWGGHGGALGPFHPLLILSNINAAARREREKAPESKAIRPPELFEVLPSDLRPHTLVAKAIRPPELFEVLPSDLRPHTLVAKASCTSSLRPHTLVA